MFSPGIERALRASIDAHAGQLRKGTGAGPVPYVVHPVHVALMVSRVLPGDDEAIQAALLHDVVEDCEGWTTERVIEQFGPRVGSIVAELTEDKSDDWAIRKQTTVDGVPGLSQEAATVKACDKLHNLSCLVADLEAAPEPEGVWAPFSGGRKGTLRVARELVEALRPRVSPSLAQALAAVLERLERF